MSLGDELRARIEKHGPIGMRDFTAAALERYYWSGPEIGEKGDFYTASNVSLFPHAIARFVHAAVERLGRDARIVELGGGRGDLAKALGGAMTIVEPMVGLAQHQRARGLQVVASLGELRPAPTVFIANEVLDALPVHRVHMTASGPREGRVAWEGGKFIEVHAPLPDALLPHVPPMEPGDVIEVALDAGAMLDALKNAAPKSVILFLDYAAGPPRPGGTLRGFHQHRLTDALERPGEQDITADVDMAFIRQLARERGFDVLGERGQGEFLADLGLLDDMMLALQRGDHDAYAAAKSLIMPGAMGERFRALCLSRGVGTEPALAGFRADTYPGASRR